MGVPFWDKNPTAWNQIVLGGRVIPGLAKVEGSFGRKLEAKFPPKSSGVILRDQGTEPAKIKITLRIWLESQLKEMPRILNQLNPRKGSTPTALDVVYPSLQLAGITSMYIEDITLLTQAEPGIYETVLTGLEFLPLKKNKGSGSGNSKVKPDVREHDTGISFPKIKVDGPSKSAKVVAP